MRFGNSYKRIFVAAKALFAGHSGAATVKESNEGWRKKTHKNFQRSF
jgi:hypothetical protein